jgi:hypothetical protein
VEHAASPQHWIWMLIVTRQAAKGLEHLQIKGVFFCRQYFPSLTPHD